MCFGFCESILLRGKQRGQSLLNPVNVIHCHTDEQSDNNRPLAFTLRRWNGHCVVCQLKITTINLK